MLFHVLKYFMLLSPYFNYWTIYNALLNMLKKAYFRPSSFANKSWKFYTEFIVSIVNISCIQQRSLQPFRCTRGVYIVLYCASESIKMHDIFVSNSTTQYNIMPYWFLRRLYEFSIKIPYWLLCYNANFPLCSSRCCCTPLRSLNTCVRDAFVCEGVCMCCRSCGNCSHPHWHSPLCSPAVILSALSQAWVQPGELADRQTGQMGAIDFSNITTAFHQKPCWPASSTMSTLTTETNSSHHP